MIIMSMCVYGVLWVKHKCCLYRCDTHPFKHPQPLTLGVSPQASHVTDEYEGHWAEPPDPENYPRIANVLGSAAKVPRLVCYVA